MSQLQINRWLRFDSKTWTSTQETIPLSVMSVMRCHSTNYPYCSMAVLNRTMARLNINMSSCQYRNSHYNDETVLRPTYPYNGNPIPGNTVFIFRRGPVSDIRIFRESWTKTTVANVRARFVAITSSVSDMVKVSNTIPVTSHAHHGVSNYLQLECYLLTR